MLHMNLRGYLSHIAEVTALLRGMASKPFLVTLNETFLTKAIGHVELEGYELLARRDRVGQWGGGVLVFVLAEYHARVTLVETSEQAERVWAIAHSDQGPYLLCCWYRPPAPGDTVTIGSLEVEYLRHRNGIMGTIILGDLNVHSKRWLKFSAGESIEGRALAELAGKLGFRQLVQEPTRGEHLLDIVLSDVSSAKARTTAAVADHKGVLTTVSFKIPETSTHDRQVWHFRDADWDRLNDAILEADWSGLENMHPSEGARVLTDNLLALAEDNIPKRSITMRKCTHPWLTERGEEAARCKHAAQGTAHEAQAAEECSEVLMNDYYDYVRTMRTKLIDARSSSKQWWSKARRLLDQKQQLTSIPALKNGSEWVMDSEAKADVFVDTFEAKNEMIAEEFNEYTELEAPPDGEVFSRSGEHIMPGVEAVENQLQNLDEDSALGPDLLPTRLLKRCAHALAPAVRALMCAILTHGAWPALWMLHWVVPLYKKRSIFDPRVFFGRSERIQGFSVVCSERRFATRNEAVPV